MPFVRPLLAVNADRSVAPASTAKLVTTLAGLELLGADWKWRTGFYAKARPDAEGRVNGIWLRGGGDPTLVAEKFGLLVERMAQMGVRRIEGDLTVDRSYFDLPEGDPSAFDGRLPPLQPAARRGGGGLSQPFLRVRSRRVVGDCAHHQHAAALGA